MFDDIASDWKNKRMYAWTPFAELLIPLLSQWMRSRPSLDPNHLIFADLGAGSGRHSEFFLQYCQRLIELDQSRPMLSKNGSPSDKLQADLTALPFRPESVDGLLAVASLHHISGMSNREDIITNMNSMVHVKGFVCITVWRFKQKRFMDLYRDHLHRSCSSCVKPLAGLNSASKQVMGSRIWGCRGTLEVISEIWKYHGATILSPISGGRISEIAPLFFTPSSGFVWIG